MPQKVSESVNEHPNQPVHPLWFMGIVNPNPIGVYSGTHRNFLTELNSVEPESGDDVKNYLESDPNSMYNDSDFKQELEDIWQKQIIAATIDFTKQSTIYFIAQSHIDIAWKWRLAQSIKKVQVTYGKAINHMEHYPSFSFSGSQPALYEMILKTQPELFEKIKQWVDKGQFELVGGCWTEPDARMPSGECFVRQFLYGQRFYLRYFHKIAEISWFQDSFGYTNQLPQLSVRSGCKYFFTNKLINNRDTIFPAGAFHWYSPDESYILAFWSQGKFHLPESMRRFKRCYRMLKPGEILNFDYRTNSPEELNIWSSELLPALGAFYGAGDGGHGPTGEEWAWVRAWTASGKNVRPSKAIEFYKDLEKVATRIPNFRDELYFENHRGTLTTHHLVKYMNRYQEWRLQGLENLCSISSIIGNNRYPYERFTRLWKNLCTSQMHDILPGSSVPEVYDDIYDLWELFKLWTDEIQENCLKGLMKNAKLEDGVTGVFICNPLPIEINEIIEIPWNLNIEPPKFVRFKDNTIKPIQLLAEDPTNIDSFQRKSERIIFSSPLQSMEQLTCEFVSTTNQPSKEFSSKIVSVNETEKLFKFENNWYSLQIEKATGNFLSLQIKQDSHGKELKSPIETLAGPSNVLQGFIDASNVEPAWNIDSAYRTKPLDSKSYHVVLVSLVNHGPVIWTLAITVDVTEGNKTSGSARFIRYISLYSTAEGIDLDTDVDWAMKGVLFKLFFTIAGNPKESIAETPYGTIHRLLRPTANHDKPRWENNMQTFLSIPSMDNSFCFNIINEGKYGFDNIEGNKIGITMIRGPHYPDVSGPSWVLPERINRESKGQGVPPINTDQGRHMIRLRLLPRAGSWEQQKITSSAHAYNCPALSRLINYKPFNTSFFDTSSTGIEIMTLKIAEENNEEHESWDNQENSLYTKVWILRAYETQGIAQSANIVFPTSFNIHEVFVADLLERKTPEKIEKDKDGQHPIKMIKARWAPHEIKTFLLYCL
jgi:alpha-mannosidase